MRLAVIIPVFGQEHLTHRLLLDIDREMDWSPDLSISVLIVDNKGNFPSNPKRYHLCQPGTNLGWAKGTNFGVKRAKHSESVDAYVCLNNDTRLSKGFFSGIKRALEVNPLVGLLGPVYDDIHAHQRTSYAGPAEEYTGLPMERSVPFVDGTCLVVPSRTLHHIGFLDEHHFGKHGWGADLDYAIRVRRAGAFVMVTHRAFLNHLGRQTANKVSSDWMHRAVDEMEAGMTVKYGAHWRDLILHEERVSQEIVGAEPPAEAPPFDLLQCSWPHPVEHKEHEWTSPVNWDLPQTSHLPTLKPRQVESESLWGISWREHFSRGLKLWEGYQSGEMRGFYVLFHLGVARSGTLVFWDDDGCVIRRNGQIIHSDPTGHPAMRHEVRVRAGDRLEIAQWQFYGDWFWAGRLEERDFGESAIEIFEPFREKVLARLSRPNGPPLKLCFSGRTPIRSTLSIYSMLLNGYRPSKVMIFGAHQWDERSREWFGRMLPFAEFVPRESVVACAQRAGADALLAVAEKNWLAMKVLTSLLCPPATFAYMDDDVFVLDPLDSALAAFADHDVVYSPGSDHSERYLNAWGEILGITSPVATGSLNAGFYLLRNTVDPKGIGADLQKVDPTVVDYWVWEQGYLACRFAKSNSMRLPSERFLLALPEGFPGGVQGYDYARNPCGFATVQFAGLLGNQPGDEDSLALVQPILNRF